MATYYEDKNGTHVTILTDEEHARCAERDTPMVNGWLAESLGGNRISGRYIVEIAANKRTDAIEARGRRLGDLLASRPGATVQEIHKFAAEMDAIADFCDAIIAGEIEGRPVSAC